MKLFFTLFLGAFANPIMEVLMQEKMFEVLNITDKATKLMFMMNPNIFGGNQHQADQMNPLLPMLLMSGDTDNSKLMMMMMMQNPESMGDMNTMLPMLMMGEDELDFKSLFLLTSMMEKGSFYTIFSMFFMIIFILFFYDFFLSFQLLEFFMIRTF